MVDALTEVLGAGLSVVVVDGVVLVLATVVVDCDEGAKGVVVGANVEVWFDCKLFDRTVVVSSSLSKFMS